MRRFLRALAASMLLVGTAVAQDEESACEVDDWRWYHTKALRVMGIEGVATCDTGRITLRA